MRPFILGMTLAAAVLVTVLVAPRFLASGAAVAARDSAVEAELARRLLHGHTPRLTDLAARSEKGAIEGGPIAKVLNDNTALLTSAEKSAAQASAAAESDASAAHVAGAVKLAKATAALDDARRLRRSMEVTEGRAILLASTWAAANRELKHAAEIDVTPSTSALRADLEELQGAHSQAQSDAEALANQIAETEKTLAGLREELKRNGEELRQLEATGFQAGSDDSFRAYRARYAELSGRMRSLQEQEQLLANGGVSGGTVVDEGLTESIENGQAVIGLAELQRRYAVADDKRRRLAASIANIESQVVALDKFAAATEADEQRYRERVAESQSELDAVKTQLAELYAQVREKDEQAAKAAQEAVQAFRNASRKIDSWQSAARQLQGAKDPQRTNERLRMIMADNAAKQELQSAEAQASSLLGRVHAERVLGLTAYNATAEQVVAYTGVTHDSTELQGALASAREAAIAALNDSHKLYEQLAQSQTPTAWVLQASLAAVDHQLAQLDELNRAQHMTSAATAISNALKGRELSPYVHIDLLRLRDKLAGAPAPAPAPEQPPPAEGAENG